MNDTMQWKRWADERPTDHTKTYRWRVSKRPILGMELQPEWTGKLTLHGMGYAAPEYWPGCSDWDGYRRTVDPSLEWREALPEETGITWNGLDLLPCPFTGKAPKITYSGRWMHAPPYLPESFHIESFLVRSYGWTDAEALQRAWNTRSNQQ